jgi:hypothetical protein
MEVRELQWQEGPGAVQRRWARVFGGCLPEAEFANHSMFPVRGLPTSTEYSAPKSFSETSRFISAPHVCCTQPHHCLDRGCSWGGGARGGDSHRQGLFDNFLIDSAVCWQTHCTVNPCIVALTACRRCGSVCTLGCGRDNRASWFRWH